MKSRKGLHKYNKINNKQKEENLKEIQSHLDGIPSRICWTKSPMTSC